MLMRIIAIISALILLTAAPLVGAHLAGQSLGEFISFPPMNVYLQPDHAPFSLSVFIIMLLFIIGIVGPFFAKVFRSRKKKAGEKTQLTRFPAWGWIGVIILLAGWVLAWSRFDWFSEWQIYTFTPLWVGYVIVINAFTYMRSRRSLITHSPVYIIVLLLVSAFFWWYFEYLNLFVENWFYINIENLSPSEFFWYATPPFATVLPAVMSTKMFLETFPGFSAGLDDFFSLRIPYYRAIALPLMLMAATALALTAIWKDGLFYMLWIAPLIIIIAAMVMAKKPTIFSGIAYGKWKQLYLWGMAALMCGFFWEMWNFYSYTQWIYAIPFVEKFYIFEMPVLGYAGYLPFGLQCGVICLLIRDIMPVKYR